MRIKRFIPSILGSLLLLAGCPDEEPLDGDGDGIPAEEDCDDADPDRFPGAPEVCNDVDDDCNGEIDDGLVFQDWYPDVDVDAYGDQDADPTSVCLDALDGHVLDATDCDDAVPTVNPGAPELCNGVDDDCDGEVDNDVRFFNWHPDVDGDTFGDEDTKAVFACDVPGKGFVTDEAGLDCNDDDATIFPGAVEIPDDDIDQDCDGFDAALCFEDGDGDTFGSETTIVNPEGDCDADGFSSNSLDCDDTSETVFPGAPEIPDDGIDQDCSLEDTVTCYVDIDEDGFGGPTVILQETDCSALGVSATNDDCDDNDAMQFPGQVWYADVDGDFFGDPLSSLTQCVEPAHHVLNADDCDDTDPDQFPGQTWYFDDDGDFFGDPAVSLVQCLQPADFVTNADDCMDDDINVNPNGVEVCDGLDNDCLNGIDDGFPNLDNDAFADCVDDDADGDGETNATDCDDFDATSCTTCGPEVCGDGNDNDCDPTTNCFEAGYVDATGAVVIVPVTPYTDPAGAAAWYSYGNPAAASSNTGFEIADRVVEMLYLDPGTGTLGIVMMSDLPNDGDGGSLTIQLSGFQGGQILWMDDPNENPSSALDATTGNGTLTYNWAPCCDDGFVIGDMNLGFCATVDITASTGVVGISLYDNQTRIDIPGGPNQAVTFCETN